MARKAAKRKPARKPSLALGADDAELVARLVERTGLSARDVIERALAAYAAAVAPGMPLVPPAAATAGGGRSSTGTVKGRVPRGRLFVSVDGEPEIEIRKPEFIFGRDPSCDIALDVALISPRHARVLFRGGQPLFEDLRSQRGTFRHGERIDVQPIGDGDEFDLGGFLPVRFRVAAKGM
jgi:pSer/pThr/pTyr-binding forkhead associated (FHA) protein